jgi:hypothetical protein
VIQPRTFDRPARVRNPRTARAATHRRIVHKSRARYSNIVRVAMTLGFLLSLFMGYVMLTSMLTGLSYSVAKARHDREALQEETIRLDDRIATLRSDDRLSVVAAHLGMKEPQRFALVRLSQPQVADGRPHFAVLSSLAGFFMPAVARQR